MNLGSARVHKTAGYKSGRLCVVSIFLALWVLNGMAITGQAGAAEPFDTEEAEPMDERCRSEVIQLHQFFEGWSTGKLDPSDENFRRFAEVVAVGFEIISPDGQLMKRDQILSRVRDSHGSRKNGTFRIWIENYRSRLIVNGVQLVTYEEWQETDGEQRGRLSSAIFQHEPDAPNGVVWLHVHETWLPARQQ